MRHPSAYLEWYVNVPKVKYDLCSSGIGCFTYRLNVGEVDLGTNYAHGNPETSKQLAKFYGVKPENVFISSEGASGQNARLVRCLAERNPQKNEAVVEYPTYEPLLRQVQEHFAHVKRLERDEKNAYRLDADELRQVVSEKTALLALTNPHAPSGAVSNQRELKTIMSVAHEYGFYVLCDEIYGEFDREAVPTLFSVDPKLGVMTSSFTKAYGLGGLKLGVALAGKRLVDEFYTDVLNTVGNSPNIVQLIAAKLLTESRDELEKHKKKWKDIKHEAGKWLEENSIEFFPNKVGITYWTKLPIKDTYKWVNEKAIPHYSLATVPGTFFLFKNDYRHTRSNRIRLSLGNMNPDKPNLQASLETLQKALRA